MAAHATRKRIGILLIIATAIVAASPAAASSSKRDKADDCASTAHRVVSTTHIASHRVTTVVDVHPQRIYADIEQPASGVLGWGIAIVADIARMPARGALVARHLLEAFAKVTPRVLQSLL